MRDVHERALENANVPYHKFLEQFRVGQQLVYGFVEGKDDPSFYRAIIDRTLPEGWKLRLIPVGNRDAVLKVLYEVDWTRFIREQVCFFIDRDFSEYGLGGQPIATNLYITDSYSIENDCISFGLLESTLRELFGVTDAEPVELDAIEAHFIAQLDKYKELMVVIMCQFILWKRAGHVVNPGNLKLHELLDVSNAEVKIASPHADAQAMLNHVGVSRGLPISSLADLAAMRIEFEGKNGKDKFIRGKYLLWFFVQYAKAVHASIGLFCSKHTSPPRKKIDFGLSNAVVVLAPRVRCPATLNTFLQRNYGTFVANYKAQ